MDSGGPLRVSSPRAFVLEQETDLHPEHRLQNVRGFRGTWRLQPIRLLLRNSNSDTEYLTEGPVHRRLRIIGQQAFFESDPFGKNDPERKGSPEGNRHPARIEPLPREYDEGPNQQSQVVAIPRGETCLLECRAASMIALLTQRRDSVLLEIKDPIS